MVVSPLEGEDRFTVNLLNLLGCHWDQLQEAPWLTVVVIVEVRYREHKEVLGPFPAVVKAVSDDDAFVAAGVKLRHCLNGFRLREEGDQRTERKARRSLEVASAVSGMSRGFAINDFGVPHEAPEADSKNPKAAGEAGLLKQGPGAFDHAAHRTLAIGIALVSVGC